ncbi:MAG: BACON domain-containing protein [Tannerella sp.]|nr:BACON domain-containing protein [Tannerella sp.]
MKTNQAMWNSLPVAAAVMLGLASCKDSEAPFVLRDTDALAYSYESSAKTFTVCTNGAWSAGSGDEWIELTPASGAGNGETRETVTARVDRNTGAERSGQIAIRAAGQEIYISVTQAEGFLIFGEPSLSGVISENETIRDVDLQIPYSRAAGDEQFAISVQVDGDAAAGIDPVNDFPVALTAESGVIRIPISGTTADAGQVTFTVTATLPNASISPLTADVGHIMRHGADFVISGYLSDPSGTDSPVIGAISGGGFTHTGGYEYVQLLALKDIDFTQAAYCLVTCINAAQDTPGARGWAAGRDGNKKTYQINIDRGSVQKGDFFYVGGISRLLDSYPPSGTVASPAVDAGKWPVAIDYYNDAGGNGNGQAVAGSGILGNWTAGDSPTNIADGIAVFRGTDVDENSVPMDAVFYGSEILTATVFRIPDSDHYRRTDAATGNPQPCFGQGGNTWMETLPPPKIDDGYYTALGGEVSATEWITPRSGINIQMKKLPDVTHSPADIENVAGCTRFVDE